MPRTPDHRITIRLSPQEYALIKAKACDGALSAFVREATLSEAARKRKGAQRQPGLQTQQAAQILALLAAHPLITAFKDAAQDPLDEEIDGKIDACHALLSETRDLLMQALGKTTAPANRDAP